MRYTHEHARPGRMESGPKHCCCSRVRGENKEVQNPRDRIETPPEIQRACSEVSFGDLAILHDRFLIAYGRRGMTNGFQEKGSRFGFALGNMFEVEKPPAVSYI